MVRSAYPIQPGLHPSTPGAPVPQPCPLRPAGSTWQAGALVGGVPRGAAGAPVLAGGGAAGHEGQLAVGAGVCGAARAVVGADLVEAGAAVAAGPRVLAALVDVLPAGWAMEAGRAAADVRGLEGQTLAAIRAGVGGTRVSLLAHLPWWASGVRGSHWPPSSPWLGPPSPGILSLVFRAPPHNTAIFLQTRDFPAAESPSQDTRGCRWGLPSELTLLETSVWHHSS